MDGIEPTLDAAALSRGVCRGFAARGWGQLTEFTLRCGRRSDVIALSGSGDIIIVEVKSSLADFLADKKWPDYQPYCDQFYFAVGERFPHARLPEAVGILISDGFDCHELRPAPTHRLAAARRKAVVLRFALAAASRLQRLGAETATVGAMLPQ